VTARSASSADVETTFDSTYDMYAIIGVRILVDSSGARVGLRLKVGGTYQTGDYKEVMYGINSNSAGLTSRAAEGSSYIEMTTQLAAQNTAVSAGSCVVYVPNPSNTTANKRAFGDFVYQGTTSSALARSSFAGTYTGSASALTGVRFLPDSSTFSGTFRLYGIKNS
jgi:hypothetical protein